MCYPTHYTPIELRAVTDAFRAMFEPSSPAPATVPPGGAEQLPVPAGAGDPTLETHDER